jgi:hypothetical protein
VSVGLLDELHDLTRSPRRQDLVADRRRLTCAKASAGQREGTSGAKLGPTDLTWAFSAAAVLLLRNTPAAQQDLARLEPQHGKGKALTILAHTWARAVYALLTRATAFALQQVRNR